MRPWLLTSITSKARKMTKNRTTRRLRWPLLSIAHFSLRQGKLACRRAVTPCLVYSINTLVNLAPRPSFPERPQLDFVFRRHICPAEQLIFLEVFMLSVMKQSRWLFALVVVLFVGQALGPGM